MTDGAKRGSDEARAWASELAEAFGKAVQLYRKRLGLSAVQLSHRCAEIGYPITRATLAKIETNGRNSKMDLAEILTLSAALEVTPSELMFPRYPDGFTRVTPRTTMRSVTARCWLEGDGSYNEFEELHTPRVTLSRALYRALDDFEHAVIAFGKRHKIEPGGPHDHFWLADQEFDKSAGGIGKYDRMVLQKEYDQIQELYDRVEDLGGHVDMPAWFGTFDCTPF